ncbi:molybdopterin-dependent oxidoreductase [Sulfurovum sp. ST-21]|uniref:Molybdopterin-dependent oxidoreductase n=1 Tax=Sulfurovum indicum TaxID=2779528 RepID=A0A7M1S189_9BACT|nr:molybdopterin-dependent oxidoreductase [Sulfurovum indicum]QOR61233.1 molybdopterin-dependent oxidoreductase [Sulfurovum indicum]
MKVEISRRKFLQGSVALSVIGGSTASLSTLLAEEKRVSHTNMKVATVCEMCVNKCTVFARVEEGIVKKLDPNPHFPKSRNMLCARGDAGIHALYDPDRLKYPLIRIGEKGDGRFKRATWEEAYEAILNGTEKFKGLKQILDEEKDNRSALGYCAGEGMGEHTFRQFMGDMLGSTNFVNHSSICLKTTTAGYALTLGAYGKADMENASYVIMAGANRAEAIMTPDTMDMFKRTRGRGLKLIVVDPRYTNTAQHADKWLGIKVGTDLAFVLALTYVAIKEVLYNKAFVSKNMNHFERYKKHILEHHYTPEWAEKITGIDAHTIRTIARDFMAHAPKAIYYQGRRTAWSLQDFQLRRAQAIFTALGGGIDVKGGIVFGKKLPLEEHTVDYPIYSNVKERIDKHEATFIGPNGTWIGFRNMIAQKRTPYPLRAFFSYKQNPMQSIPNIAKTRKMFENLDLVVTIDTMPSDTVMMSDVVLPECTYLEREDPVKSFAGAEPAIVLRNKTIEPLYETKALFDILKGLSKTISKPLFEISAKYDDELKEAIESDGFEEVFEENNFDLSRAFEESQEEINKERIVSEYGEEAYRILKEKGVFYPHMDDYFRQLSTNEYQYYPEDKKYYTTPGGEKLDAQDTCIDEKEMAALKKNLGTKSGKVECYLDTMAKNGQDPMPTWREELYTKTPKGKFKFITGRHAQQTQNSTANNIMLLDVMRENYIWINKEQAEEKGIKHGDVVEVKSAAGVIYIKAYPTIKIIKDVVFYVHGFGQESTGLTFGYRNGASDNMIIEDKIESVFGSAAMHETLVEVRKV